MKKPSLDAIRKFKEQKEREKIEEENRKQQEKISLIKFRAQQGDRKAKHLLNRVEKIKKDETQRREQVQSSRTIIQKPISTNIQPSKPKEKKVLADFEELMKIAQQNKNELKRPTVSNQIRDNDRRAINDAIRPQQAKQLSIIQSIPSDNVSSQSDRRVKQLPDNPARIVKEVSRKQNQSVQPQRPPPSRLPQRPQQLQQQSRSKPVNIKPTRPVIKQTSIPNRPRNITYRREQDYDDDDDEEEEEEDEYEVDDFVVDDEEDEARHELQKTLKNIFGYDKKKYDRREADLEREYRMIGNVSTFEDLEREEKRSSRLAAAEDAKALREEEDRKRLKLARKKEKYR